MAGFSAEWLALREPVDHRARSTALARAAMDALPQSGGARILDLAAGTGSNLRYLSTLTRTAASPMSSEWLLVDHDPALLSRVPALPGVETRCLELSTLDDRQLFAGRSLVTASALLDLVSEAWLRALASRCAEAGAAVLFALSYDGRIVCTPEDRDDRSIVGRVNEHQRTDKGFGPALGPEAVNGAQRVLGDCGYRVARARSDWLLTSSAAELQRQLVDGWARAAVEIAPAESAAIEGWRQRRQTHIDANRSSILVGHEDLMGLLERLR